MLLGGSFTMRKLSWYCHRCIAVVIPLQKFAVKVKLDDLLSEVPILREERGSDTVE